MAQTQFCRKFDRSDQLRFSLKFTTGLIKFSTGLYKFSTGLLVQVIDESQLASEEIEPAC